MSSRVLNASKPPASTNRVPTSTSSSGKASTARRNWSVMMACSTASRLAVRLTDASPMSTQGVPPMRSRVQNEKPLRLVALAGQGDRAPTPRPASTAARPRTGSAPRRRCRPSRPARRRSAGCSPWSRPRSPCASQPLVTKRTASPADQPFGATPGKGVVEIVVVIASPSGCGLLAAGQLDGPHRRPRTSQRQATAGRGPAMVGDCGRRRDGRPRRSRGHDGAATRRSRSDHDGVGARAAPAARPPGRWWRRRRTRRAGAGPGARRGAGTPATRRGAR